jgi:large subunit ribosomal protein L18
MIKNQHHRLHQRQTRVRSKIKAVGHRPRLSVFRSSKHIYAQIIDDSQAKTLVAASDSAFDSKESKTAKAKLVGQAIAQKALKKKITQVVFDRGPYKYHGRVKALAEAAREKGLKF